MEQGKYLCQKAGLYREWLATQEVFRRLRRYGDNQRQVAEVIEVLDEIDGQIRQLEEQHYGRSPEAQPGAA